MPIPTDPLDLLTRSERRWYRFADWLDRRAPWVSVLWNQLWMVNMVRIVAGHRLRVRGLERIAHLGPDASLILVANHRSFFDFFVIGAVLYTKTRLPKRILFPVRAAFFYEGWLGAGLNALMAGFTMFPPILREAERGAYNRHAMERCGEALARGGQMIGMHPEGKRNGSADPLDLLPAQHGIGRLALQAPGAKIIPIWIEGLSNSFRGEVKDAWSRSGPPIEICIGAPMDIEDLRGKGVRAVPEIANRCMAEIRELGLEVRGGEVKRVRTAGG